MSFLSIVWKAYLLPSYVALWLTGRGARRRRSSMERPRATASRRTRPVLTRDDLDSTLCPLMSVACFEATLSQTTLCVESLRRVGERPKDALYGPYKCPVTGLDGAWVEADLDLRSFLPATSDERRNMGSST